MAKANTGTTVKKVLLRIKRYWFFLILSILMAAVTVASSLYVPILIGNAIDYIIGPQNVEFKAITAILSEVGIVIAITGTVPVDYEYLQQQNYVSCDKGYP